MLRSCEPVALRRGRLIETAFSNRWRALSLDIQHLLAGGSIRLFVVGNLAHLRGIAEVLRAGVVIEFAE